MNPGNQSQKLTKAGKRFIEVNRTTGYQMSPVHEIKKWIDEKTTNRIKSECTLRNEYYS